MKCEFSSGALKIGMVKANTTPLIRVTNSKIRMILLSTSFAMG